MGQLPRTNRVSFVSKALRSGLKRYPKAIANSLKKPTLTDLRESTFAARWEDSKDRRVVAWLGHASILLRLGGMTILTDPVLSRRIGVRIVGLTIGVERTDEIAVHVPHLPPIDLILITHAHFDHLDTPTLRALASKRTRVITAGKTRRLIPRGFASVEELRWNTAMTVGDIEISALRPAHWGARLTWDRHREYNSYVLRSTSGHALLAGDSAFTDAFDSVKGLDLAAFGIGAYRPWIHAHASPEQVWAMFTASQASKLLPVHHSTFQLGDEPPSEPMELLLRAAAGDAERILQVLPGEIAVW